MIQLELHLLRLLLTVFFSNVAAESSVHRFALIRWPCCLLRLRKWSFSCQWHQESAGCVSTRRMRSLRQWRPQLKTSCIRFVSPLGDCFLISSEDFGSALGGCIGVQEHQLPVSPAVQMRSVEGEVVDLALPVNVVEGEKPCTQTSHNVLLEQSSCFKQNGVTSNKRQLHRFFKDIWHRGKAMWKSGSWKSRVLLACPCEKAATIRRLNRLWQDQ